MRTNYVLIDYENVQPASLAGLEAEHFRVLLFVGASQAKVPIGLAAAMQALGTRAEYILVTGNGSNALDLHIAFSIGLLCAKDPEGYFHVISKDTGFDPLIRHLRSRGIASLRSEAIGEIPLVRAAGASTVPERVAVVVEDLQRRGQARPKSVKALSGTIGALFRGAMDGRGRSEVIGQLQARGLISIEADRVSYALPGGRDGPRAGG